MFNNWKYIWRFSHLSLALTSALFLLLAALSGIILALGAASLPLQKDYDLDSITIQESVNTFKETYVEVIYLQVDENNFFKASVVDSKGTTINGYFHPETAAYLGNELGFPNWYKKVVNFHRSLFLKTTGRILVGVCAFFLFLLSASGLGLLIKRQGSLKAAFGKVIKINTLNYNHIILGRWSLVPLTLIALSGVYLSFYRFNYIPKQSQAIQKDIPQNLFSSATLQDLINLDFPFSEFEDDYFYIETTAYTADIHQYNGKTISLNAKNGFTKNHKLFSELHTGKGNFWYALVLFVSCLNLLYFLYSGIKIFSTRKTQKKVKIKKQKQADWLILYGSESGTTEGLAHLVGSKFKDNGLTVNLKTLDDFSPKDTEQKLVILTATYGEGEPPQNAEEFYEAVMEDSQWMQGKEIELIGFGSKQYKHFCGFAKNLENVLKAENTIKSSAFINNYSIKEIITAIQPLGIELSQSELADQSKMQEFEVVKTDFSQLDETALFNLELQASKRVKFESGDLMAIQLENKEERLYSISKIDKRILLSVKRHEKGLGSNYLSKQQIGDRIQAKILKNSHFHLPGGKKPLLLIANGTGVAPFLGMISEAKKSRKIHLILGLKSHQELEIYEKYIDRQKLESFEIIYSREAQKHYVQDDTKTEELIGSILKQEGSVMVCGSNGMEEGLKIKFHTQISKLEKKQAYFSDCY